MSYLSFIESARAVDIPGSYGSPFSTPGQIINKLLPNVIAAAAVIFFVLILGGGFTLVKNAGSQASPQDTAKAKAAITYGVIGFLLVVSAYSILQIVKLITGIDFLNI